MTSENKPHHTEKKKKKIEGKKQSIFSFISGNIWNFFKYN